eukprot:Skav220178  [mRNA]  locus=scaffold1271:222155:252662:+ [translate_table: standard]
MEALGLDQVLNLAQQYGAVGAAEPIAPALADRPPARRAGGGLRRHHRAQAADARQRGARWARKQRQLVLQSKCFNKTGHARTADHRLPNQDLNRQRIAGKGKWKTWTPEAILRAGFGHETATFRQIANEVEGASCSQARAARFACAAAVLKSQAESCEKVAAQATENPLSFVIQNVMFDESTFELRVGKDSANSCSVLCSHSQWTMGAAPASQGDKDAVRDEHIVRSPQVLAPMNSATMWKALSCHPGSVGPCQVVADRVCTLTTCDSHAANLKMLKHLDSVLPSDHYFLPMLCAQHRNGNVVEQLTHLLGNLGGCFCVSRVLNSRHAVQALRKRAAAGLEEHLVVLQAEPVGVQAEWEEARSLTRSFLKLASMFEARCRSPAKVQGCACSAGAAREVVRLRVTMSTEQLAQMVDLEVEQRLGNLLRNFPSQDVQKKESDYRCQVVTFCEAIVAEQSHPDSELSNSVAKVASMVVDLLSLGDVVALQRGAEKLKEQEANENPGSVVAFFTKHKVGQSLTQASAEVMVEGAARVNVEQALQDATAALRVVKDKDTAGEEELSGIVALFFEKKKLVLKEIADMKKQGTHTQKASSRATQEMENLSMEMWSWLNSALKAEFLNTLCGVLENSAALLTPTPETSGAQFSIQDVEEVLRNDEVLKHTLWNGLGEELKKEKKILKLFDFYKSLAEQSGVLVKFALSQNSKTHFVFQGAALPAKPLPEVLHKLKGLPEQLQQLSKEEGSVDQVTWAALLQAVEEELASQQNAGFVSLGELIQDFLDRKPEASKAKLEEVLAAWLGRTEGPETLVPRINALQTLELARSKVAPSSRSVVETSCLEGYKPWQDWCSRERTRLLQALISHGDARAKALGQKTAEVMAEVSSFPASCKEGPFRAAVQERMSPLSTSSTLLKKKADELQSVIEALCADGSPDASQAAGRLKESMLKGKALQQSLVATLCFFAALTLFRSPALSGKSEQAKKGASDLNALMHSCFVELESAHPCAWLDEASMEETLLQMSQAVKKVFDQMKAHPAPVDVAARWENAQEKRKDLPELSEFLGIRLDKGPAVVGPPSSQASPVAVTKGKAVEGEGRPVHVSKALSLRLRPRAAAQTEKQSQVDAALSASLVESLAPAKPETATAGKPKETGCDAMASSVDQDAPSYVDRVTARLLASDMASLMDWTHARETTVAEHIDHVFSMAALEDTTGRASMILHAIEEQEKFLKEKRARKSVKLVRAAQKAIEMARKNNSGGYNKAQALAAAAFVEDAISYVLSLDPPPEEFVCAEPLVKRRLRVRQAAPKETKAEIAQQRAKATQRILIGGSRPRVAEDEARPWLVEAAGEIFETPPLRNLSEQGGNPPGEISEPPPLRNLSEKGGQRRPGVEPSRGWRGETLGRPWGERGKVLHCNPSGTRKEGYQPTKRSSVPCSGSPAEAVAAFLKVSRRSKEEREVVEKKRKENLPTSSEDGIQVVDSRGMDDRLWDLWDWTSAHELFPVLSEDQRGVRAAVLSVQVPLELQGDVVTNPSGGFSVDTSFTNDRASDVFQWSEVPNILITSDHQNNQ